MTFATAASTSFNYDEFHARAKVFDITPKFYFEDAQGRTIGFLKQKLFKLKEDIRLYADESASQELLRIQARNVIDFSASYDVTDSLSGQKVGALQRRGLKSMFKDEWIMLSASNQEIGRIMEESALLATLRRFLSGLIPQKYVFHLDGQPIGTARQRFNPFVQKMDVAITRDPGRRLDRRLVAAAVVLLLAVEGRQG